MGIVEDEQNAAREELLAAVRQRTEADAAIKAAVKRCREARLPVAEIARVADVTRETVYRWTGRPVR